jgi:hypothetical protein
VTIIDDLTTLPNPVMTPAERVWDAYHYIEAHPEQWDQEYWGHIASCGTTFCLAGRILDRAGYMLIPDNPIHDPLNLNVVELASLPAHVAAAASEAGEITGAALPVVGVEWLVNHILNIDESTGEDLWDSGNNLEALRRTIEDVFGPDPVK